MVRQVVEGDHDGAGGGDGPAIGGDLMDTDQKQELNIIHLLSIHCYLTASEEISIDS